jgi:hypothetical protein
MSVKDKKWFQALLKIAPGIATALGGPFGGLATNVLKQVTGLDEASVEKAIIEGDPSVFESIKKAELEFQVQMEKLKLDREALDYEDIKSARERHIQTKDAMPAVLAVLAWVQWAAIIVILFFGNNLEILQTPEQREVLMFVLATTQAIVIGAFQFYHGSSRGSRIKDSTIEKLGGKTS